MDNWQLPSEQHPLIYVRLWSGDHIGHIVGHVRSFEELAMFVVDKLPENINLDPFNHERILAHLKLNGWNCMIDAYTVDHVSCDKESKTFPVGTLVTELLMVLGFSSSKSESARLIKASAVAIGGVIVEDPKAVLDGLPRRVVVRKSKRSRALIQVV